MLLATFWAVTLKFNPLKANGADGRFRVAFVAPVHATLFVYH